MKLTRISLKDFRCFREAVFDLTEPGRTPVEPLGVALFVGDNGSGKTAVLDALSGCFTELSSQYGGDRLIERDVRQGATESLLEIHWTDLLGPRLPRMADLSEFRRQSFSVKMTMRPHDDLDWKQSTSPSLKGWLHHVQRMPGRPTGLVTSFDLYRLLPPGPVPGPNLHGTLNGCRNHALAPTISDDGKVRGRSQSVKQWIVNLDFQRARAKADRNEDLPLWHSLRHALNTLVHPYTFEGSTTAST